MIGDRKDSSYQMYDAQNNHYRLEDQNSTAKNNSYYNLNNDHNHSKFDQSNTLANLLMFQSGAYDQEIMPAKRSEKNNIEDQNVLEEQNQAQPYVGSYPQYFKDNKINICEDDYSEQSEDLLCNFLLKLFNVLAYKVRIMQRGSFQNMFIEASRRVMQNKFHKDLQDSIDSNEKGVNTSKEERDQEKLKLISFSKSQSLDIMMPIKEQSESEITKKESGITFNMKNQQFSRNSSEFCSKPQSNMVQSIPDMRNNQLENNSPFSFNSKKKRKNFSFQRPKANLSPKVQIESLQNIEANKKSQTNLSNQNLPFELEDNIKLEEQPLDYFQRSDNKSLQITQKCSIFQMEIQSPPEEVLDHNDTLFFEGMEALIDISMYSRTNSHEHSSNEEYLKIYENNGILIHYETDQNTEEESKEKNQVHTYQTIEEGNTYSAMPFCHKLVKNGYTKDVKQSFYIFPNPRNSMQQVAHPLQNKLQTKSSRPVSNYPILNGSPSSQLVPSQWRPISQIYKQKTDNINIPNQQIQSPQSINTVTRTRPFSHMQIRATSPRSFIVPRVQRQNQKKQQINIRYFSPNTSRPRSQEPRMSARFILNGKPEQQATPHQDKVHIVRSQYFIDQTPINYTSPSQKTHVNPKIQFQPPSHLIRNSSPIYNQVCSPRQSNRPQINFINGSKENSSATETSIMFSSKQANKMKPSMEPVFSNSGKDSQMINQYYDIDIKKPTKSKKKLDLVSSKDNFKKIVSHKKS